MSFKASNAQTLKRLRDEYAQQEQLHKKMIRSEKEFYQNSLNVENERHNSTMVQIKQDQSERMQSLKEKEEEFLKQINEIKTSYAHEKKKIERKHQQEIRLLEESRDQSQQQIESNYQVNEVVPDVIYAEAVIAELLRIQNRNINEVKLEERSSNSKKIRLILDALEAHSKLLRSFLANSDL